MSLSHLYTSACLLISVRMEKVILLEAKGSFGSATALSPQIMRLLIKLFRQYLINHAGVGLAFTGFHNGAHKTA